MAIATKQIGFPQQIYDMGLNRDLRVISAAFLCLVIASRLSGESALPHSKCFHRQIRRHSGKWNKLQLVIKTFDKITYI